MTTTLQDKQKLLHNWGFLFPFSKAVGYRTAPNGWMEIWRSHEPDIIGFYQDSDYERDADMIFPIQWEQHDVTA